MRWLGGIVLALIVGAAAHAQMPVPGWVAAGSSATPAIDFETIGDDTPAGFGAFTVPGLTGALIFVSVTPSGGGAATDLCLSTDYDGVTPAEITLNGSAHTGSTCVSSDYGKAAHALAASYVIAVSGTPTDGGPSTRIVDLTVETPGFGEHEETVKSHWAYANHPDTGTTGNHTQAWQLGNLLLDDGQTPDGTIGSSPNGIAHTTHFGDSIVLRPDCQCATGGIASPINPVHLTLAGVIGSTWASASGGQATYSLSSPVGVAGIQLTFGGSSVSGYNGTFVVASVSPASSPPTVTVTMTSNPGGPGVGGHIAVPTYSLETPDAGPAGSYAATAYAGQQPVTIQSAAYNKVTGLVTATLNTSLGASPGQTISVLQLSGIGVNGSGTGIANGSFVAGPGTSGTTLTWTIPAGLTLSFNSGTGWALLPITIRSEKPTVGNDSWGNFIGGGDATLGAVTMSGRGVYGAPALPSDTTATTTPLPYFFDNVTHAMLHPMATGEESSSFLVNITNGGTGTATAVADGWTETNGRYLLGANLAEQCLIYECAATKMSGGVLTWTHFTGPWYGQINANSSTDNPGPVICNDLFEGFVQNGIGTANLYNPTFCHNFFYNLGSGVPLPRNGMYFSIAGQFYQYVTGIPAAQGQIRIDPGGSWAQTLMNTVCAVYGNTNGGALNNVVNWATFSLGKTGTFDCGDGNPAHYPVAGSAPNFGAKYAPTYSAEAPDPNFTPSYFNVAPNYEMNLVAKAAGTALNTGDSTVGSANLGSCNVATYPLLCWFVSTTNPASTLYFGGYNSGSPAVVQLGCYTSIPPGASATWSATSGGQATFTVATGLTANWTSGDTITVTGATTSGYNGTWTVVSTTATSVTVTMASNPGAWVSTNGASINNGSGKTGLQPCITSAANSGFAIQPGSTSHPLTFQLQFDYIHSDCLIYVTALSPPPASAGNGFPFGQWTDDKCIIGNRPPNVGGSQGMFSQDTQNFGFPGGYFCNNDGFDVSTDTIVMDNMPGATVCANLTMTDFTSQAYDPTDPSYDIFFAPTWVSNVPASLINQFFGSGYVPPSGFTTGGASSYNLSNRYFLGTNTNITAASATPNPNEAVTYGGLTALNSGSYNHLTNVIMLNLNAAAIFNVGDNVTLSSLGGTGSFASLEGGPDMGPVLSVSGPTNTITLTGPTPALSSDATITSGKANQKPTNGQGFFASTMQVLFPNLNNTSTQPCGPPCTPASVVAQLTPAPGIVFTASTVSGSATMSIASGWAPVIGEPINGPVGSGYIAAGDIVVGCAAPCNAFPYLVTLQTTATGTVANGSFATGAMNPDHTWNGPRTGPDANGVACENVPGQVVDLTKTCAAQSPTMYPSSDAGDVFGRWLDAQPANDNFEARWAA